MNSLYFAALVGLALTAFFLGRRRAVAVAGDGKGVLHSLPAYHGLLAAASVFTAMLFVVAVGAPLAEWIARTSALAVLPADIVGDELKRGAALRDAINIAAGLFSGAPSPELQGAADAYSRMLSVGTWSMLAGGVALA